MSQPLTMNDASVFRRHPDAAFRMFEGEGVVLMPSGAEVHVLNEVGARVWDLIDGQRDVAAIVGIISEEYDVGRDQAETDVRDFIGSLLERNMIVSEQNAAPTRTGG